MSELDRTTLIEASWEVANKVGGIYTVLATKSHLARASFPEHYLPVGPYTGPTVDFVETTAPESWAPLLAELEKQGVVAHYGTWQIAGKPVAVRLAFDRLVGDLNTIKTTLWERYKLDTLGTEFYDVDQPLLWSVAVARFASAYSKLFDTTVVLHAHEWLAGGAILALTPDDRKRVRTVFTTHATTLGRALSNDGSFIYTNFDSVDPEAEAKRLRVTAKHQIERISAEQADVFTTVSTVTAREAKAYLGVEATVVENGLDLSQFPTYDSIVTTRTEGRQSLDNFVSSYFFPSYRFNLADTKYVFTMGRYEFSNKGYDIALKALGNLNTELKGEHSHQTVVAFFFVPGDSLRLRPDVSHQITTYAHIQRILRQFAQAEERRIEREIWDDVDCSCTLMPEHARDQVRRLLDQIRTTRNPAISPFDLRNPDGDAILRAAAEFGLTNAPEDRVKLLFFPVYLEGFDGALNMPLYDIIPACDLGLFPSRYEPWGYTPMESLVFGVPAVTSTLAGFGQAADPNPGIMVLNRDSGNGEADTGALQSYLRAFLGASPRDWVERRLAAYSSVNQFDWERLYPKYLRAYTEALS